MSEKLNQIYKSILKMQYKYIPNISPIVDRYYSLIRPPFDYPGKNGVALTWIHGFTEDMLVSFACDRK